MAKTVIKETFIILLTTIAIGLVLAVIFYQFIPSNKIIPIQVTAYSAPAEVQKEVSETANEELSESYEVYEITDSDLDLFKSSKSYNPGKVDPFSSGAENNSNSGGEGGQGVNSPSGNSSAPTEDGNATSGGNVDAPTQSPNAPEANTTGTYYEASHIEGRYKII